MEFEKSNETDLFQKLIELMEKNNKLVSNVQWELTQTRLTSLKKIQSELDQIKKIQFGHLVSATEIISEEISEFYSKQKLGYIETIDLIRDEGMSFARYGDGELSIIIEPTYGLGFQNNHIELAEELATILYSKDNKSDKLLVGLPEQFRGDSHWQHVWPRIYPAIKHLIGNGVIYGQAQISRPIFFARYRKRALDAWKSVWKGRDCCFIYGEGSRFTKSDSLFSTMKSSRDILSKAKNSFDDIDRVLDVISKDVSKDTLILLALGPAATVLVARLARLGYQAIDIGHLSASYEYWAHGAPPPESLPA